MGIYHYLYYIIDRLSQKEDVSLHFVVLLVYLISILKKIIYHFLSIESHNFNVNVFLNQVKKKGIAHFKI